MIEHRILTQKDIDTYPHKGKTAQGPWCKLCSVEPTLVTRGGYWPPKHFKKGFWIPTYIHPGEACVRVTFRNHTVAYYHQTCWDAEKNTQVIKSIEKQG